MDLQTLSNKLTGLEYSDPWDFIADAYKIAENAWLYNKRTSKVHKQATRVCFLSLELVTFFTPFSLLFDIVSVGFGIQVLFIFCLCIFLQLNEFFEKIIDEPMQKNGFCCGKSVSCCCLCADACPVVRISLGH